MSLASVSKSTPAIETESDDAITVQAEVPGFSANELQVSIESNRLTISGKKEMSKEERQKAKTIYNEQCSIEHLRIIVLPVEVDSTKTTATLWYGVPDFTMPRGGQAKSTRVEVKAA